MKKKALILFFCLITASFGQDCPVGNRFVDYNEMKTLDDLLDMVLQQASYEEMAELIIDTYAREKAFRELRVGQYAYDIIYETTAYADGLKPTCYTLLMGECLRRKEHVSGVPSEAFDYSILNVTDVTMSLYPYTGVSDPSVILQGISLIRRR